MRKPLSKLILLMAFFFCLIPRSLAAGCLLSPKNEEKVSETAQKAIIFHRANEETMVINVEVIGKAKNVGWLIPLPQKPELTTHDYLLSQTTYEKMFANFDRWTRKKKNKLEKIKETNQNLLNKYLKFIFPHRFKKQSTRQKSPSSFNIKNKLFLSSWGPAEIKVIAARDTSALNNWLNENNYEVTSKTLNILNEYASQNWYLVLAKFPHPNKSSLFPFLAPQNITSSFYLKLTFKTSEAFYPFKISAENQLFNLHQLNKRYYQLTKPFLSSQNSTLNSLQESKITIYLLADHKKIPQGYQLEDPSKGFSIDYAARIKKKDIESLVGSARIAPLSFKSSNLYLTKLISKIKPENRQLDLSFKTAPDDNPVNTGTLVGKEKWFLPLWFLWYKIFKNPLFWLIFIILFFLLVFIYFRVSSVIGKIIIFIPQGIALIIASVLFIFLTKLLLMNPLNISLRSIILWGCFLVTVGGMYGLFVKEILNYKKGILIQQRATVKRKNRRLSKTALKVKK